MSGSRIIDVCITHTCIRVKDRRPKIHACIRIMYKCTHHASYICASWPRVSGSRIYALYIHQGQGSYIQYMHQDQESRIIDTCKQACIIHACINSSCVMCHASCIMHHLSCIMHHASCIIHQRKLNTPLKEIM